MTDSITLTRAQVEELKDSALLDPYKVDEALGRILTGVADDDEPTAEDRIENAVQAMSETHSSWESRCHAIMAALGKDFGRLQPVADDDTRIVFEQEWTPNYLSVEDSGAARIYCVEPVDESLRMEVRLHGYDEDCNHETFKQFEGKRIRVTVEAIEE
jgi:hypothetical protein